MGEHGELLAGLAGLALAGAGLLWPRRAAAAGPATAPAARFARARALAMRWHAAFPAVAPALALAIMYNESRFAPAAANFSPAAMQRGGAYGLMGMTAATAGGLLPAARRHPWPVFAAPALQTIGALGLPAALYDPDANALFGFLYLDQLTAEFHDPSLVAAAYHSGPATVRRLLQAHKDVAQNLGPKGRAYVAQFARVYPPLGKLV